MSEFIPIKISNRAIAKIKEIMASKNVPNGYGLRVLVQGKGCLGFNFDLGFDQPNESDLVVDDREIKIIVSKRNMIYVVGQVLDYIQQGDRQGFTFSNSN